MVGIDGPWWVVAGAALPSLASGLWVVSRYWVERSDRSATDARTREERLVEAVEARRAALLREQAELFERMRAELSRCQCRLAEMERNRDRGWDLARHWHRRCHELRQGAINAQAIVAGFCERDGIAVPEWPEMTVGILEEPRS